ncbi:hypothetical protein UR09_03965 [Candidatus Nitromaritima sp. SCGC AAA799-A02]|nr:hypothetical protein UR09_03965 [Candidatus Nitromaritima sp. SCGC AAA799-A02]
MDNKLIDTKQAAEILGVSAAFLERDRWRGATIPFVRIGNGKGAVRYSVEILQNYIKARTVQTGEVEK